MSCRYCCAKYGNGFSIILREQEIVKVWFDVEGESKSPLNKDEAELMAKGILEFLNERFPVTSDVAEKFGDSDKSLDIIKNFEESEDDIGDPSELLAKLMLARILYGG